MPTMRTLFLNPPAYCGFDASAGARYPIWLAQPAALIPNSKLIDAPADGLNLQEVLQRARGFELCVVHAATPTFDSDIKVAEALKRAYPDMKLGLVGAHVAVLPEESLKASEAIDFVAREEFDYTLLEVARGRPYAEVAGLSWREEGQVRHNPDRQLIFDMDALPSVIDVYKRDLTVENYSVSYLQRPTLSLYTGRGCPSRCTFCLWPQTLGGHVYRARSAPSVIAELLRARELFPQVKEFFLDDDTFSADLPRAAEIAKGLGQAGITWSCSSRADVPYEHLKLFKENGLRLLLVGYESGNQRILDTVKKGLRLDAAREFTRNCRRLGILIHGTFILGLPGETRETIEESMRFARGLDVETIQVSLAAAYPGTELHRQASAGPQSPLPTGELEAAVRRFYSKFYGRPRPILRLLAAMARDPALRRRRLREGRDFLAALRGRQKAAA